MQHDARVGSVAALMLAPGERGAIDSFGVSADVTLAGFARLQGRRPAAIDASGPALTGPEGTAGAYRRAAWEQVGGFDETISAYMEILDLALRLRSAGWSTAQAPDAVGVHLGSVTYGSARPRNAGWRASAAATCSPLRRVTPPRRPTRAAHRGARRSGRRDRSAATCRRCAGAWKAGGPPRDASATRGPPRRRSTIRSRCASRSRCAAGR